MKTEKRDQKNFVRVTFKLDDCGSTERLWATAMPDAVYRLENSPFLAYGVSFEDLVSCNKVGQELYYERTVSCSGRSTYRLVPLPRWKQLFDEYWRKLQAIGCTYEQGTNNLLSVDVPPGTDIYKAFDLLTAGERDAVWSFEEGHCGHNLNRRIS